MNAIDMSKSSKTVEYIAQLYIQDSKRYSSQADYWLAYLTKYGNDIQDDDDNLSLIRKIESLRAALLFDRGEISLAYDLLVAIRDDFELSDNYENAAPSDKD